MSNRIGGQTIKLENPPCILSRATIVGKKEGEGPLGEFFDVVLKDDYFGEKKLGKGRMPHVSGSGDVGHH